MLKFRFGLRQKFCNLTVVIDSRKTKSESNLEMTFTHVPVRINKEQIQQSTKFLDYYLIVGH